MASERVTFEELADVLLDVKTACSWRYYAEPAELLVTKAEDKILRNYRGYYEHGLNAMCWGIPVRVVDEDEAGLREQRELAADWVGRHPKEI